MSSVGCYTRGVSAGCSPRAVSIPHRSFSRRLPGRGASGPAAQFYLDLLPQLLGGNSRIGEGGVTRVHAPRPALSPGQRELNLSVCVITLNRKTHDYNTHEERRLSHVFPHFSVVNFTLKIMVSPLHVRVQVWIRTYGSFLICECTDVFIGLTLWLYECTWIFSSRPFTNCLFCLSCSPQSTPTWDRTFITGKFHAEVNQFLVFYCVPLIFPAIPKARSHWSQYCSQLCNAENIWTTVDMQIIGCQVNRCYNVTWIADRADFLSLSSPEFSGNSVFCLFILLLLWEAPPSHPRRNLQHPIDSLLGILFLFGGGFCFYKLNWGDVSYSRTVCVFPFKCCTFLQIPSPIFITSIPSYFVFSVPAEGQCSINCT